jgi:hypothetical protein
MGQHVADIDFTAVEMDGGDEAVLVAANVEHDKVADFVRRWKGGSHCLKAHKVPAISGDLLSAVISTRYILGFRKDNPNVFNRLVQNLPHC